eukprot:TRINITY_DN2137_c0_g1_i20.p1 TRINITY_DN2137_c0_g1~~TRINITY_DN2137_c0_g1_i20.p1  ORF type:complete len:220 (+),score=67.01 TRINITY_DN2137_c0_g1_i20:123-782(+)
MSFNSGNHKGQTQLIETMISTPHSERIQRIADRLSSIQIGEESHRHQRYDTLEARIKVLEERLAENQEAFSKRIGSLKEGVTRLAKLVEEEKHWQGEVLEKRGADLAALDGKFSALFDSEEGSRREGEVKVIRVLEDKVAVTRGEVAKEAAARTEQIEALEQALAADLPRLFDAVKLEASEREANDAALLRRCNEEVARLSALVTQERKSRQELSLIHI